MAGYGPNPPDRVRGRARQLCPGTSDVDFLGYLKRVVDLNAEIAARRTLVQVLRCKTTELQSFGHKFRGHVCEADRSKLRVVAYSLRLGT